MKNDKIESINLISDGTIVEGNIKCDNSIRIDGTIIGNITSQKKVIIGNNGKMLGHLNCLNADIFGYFNGDIKITEILFLKDTANIQGDCHAKKLIVESGAIISGNFHIGDSNKLNDSKSKKSI
ncbi:MAG: polymer-forming cytoskeletal protein [Bacteroides sp.]|nr:MAG: polymer-forming cytoskeletal protein [Bacteroides sp.]